MAPKRKREFLMVEWRPVKDDILRIALAARAASMGLDQADIVRMALRAYLASNAPPPADAPRPDPTPPAAANNDESYGW